MSRSGYSDDCDNNWSLIRWRGAVTSAIKGKRGQAFLKEMLDALDAMPEKALIADDLVRPGGEVCAMGAVGLRRGINMDDVDPEDREQVAETFGVSRALVAEIAYENDEGTWKSETPQQRWERMRKWVVSRLVTPPQPSTSEAV